MYAYIPIRSYIIDTEELRLHPSTARFFRHNLAVIQYNIYSSRDFHNLSTFFFPALYTYYVVYYNITNSVPIGARQLLYTMNNDERLPRSLCLRNVSNAEPEGRKPWGVSYV